MTALTEAAPRGPRLRARWAGLRRQPALLASLAIVLLFALLAALAPVLFPGANDIAAGERLLPPSLLHPFGTDELGRDLLARIAHAGRLTLVISLGAMLLSILLGLLWGMLAAAFGGWVDEVLMRTADAILAIPMVLFGLVCVAALGSSPLTLILVLGVLKAPLTARVIRSSTLQELASDYVRGLTIVGVGRPRMLFLEVFPNVFPTVVAQATLNIASAIMLEATLSFLGLGVQPPEASWGTLLKAGYVNLHQAWWYVLIPAIVIVALVASFNQIGQYIQRVLDRRAQ